jgi:hypothetical protein
MKGLSASFIAVLVTAILFAANDSANSQSTRKYCNSRFGFCVEYPAHFGMKPAPANDDGRDFYDGDGFRMTASGMNNALEDTLKSEMQAQEQSFDTISYRSTGKNWYVLSGHKGNEIVYLKTFVGKEAINHLHISYPVRMKMEYEGIVTRISKSFSPGRL